ncbi:VacJ family lipoprotein [Phenylobacterium sp. 20VBR1]|uniref:VacJ family lipoprotein n=1 Tax=Phenylobacterium glaciei TaxID=2803784 RepID=A0A941D084_9CAUL|nr:VacJ family lipoprotein [Phenylobacterium glaciei]MBR7619132.1 VacJ family lipoprotein [Phenylobacterium glaciei]
MIFKRDIVETHPGVERPRAGTPLILALGLALSVALGGAAWTQAVEEPPAAADSMAVEAAPAPPATLAPAAAKDPWRRFNRGSYAFNGFLDRALIRPITRAYMKITPSPVRRGLGRVVDNLREPSTVLNASLQGHPRRAVQAGVRFAINSTVGVLGVFDVASRVGLDRSRADFGQTLGRYGVGTGPYLYLPLVGPLNVRDGLGQVVDALTDPISLATGGLGSDFGAGRLGVTALDYRSSADATLAAVAEEATDPYATIQSAYLQNRESVVREATGAVEVLPDFEAAPDTPAPAETVALAANNVSEPIY